MNTNKKAIMALVMVLVMLAVPLTAIEQSEESDAGTVAPTPSHYAYKVTYTTTEGASQSQIDTVTNLVTSTAMTAATTSSQGDWKWSTTTGLGPFNMFYAAISTGQSDSGALSEKAGHVAYILDPLDLTKAVKGKSISASTSISDVISKYNIMLVIPTVYWYSDAAGNLYIADQADSSYLPNDTVKANMKAYAHQVDNATVYPYLAIGVYEAYDDPTYGLMSATGKTPKASTKLPEFRSYAEESNDLITDECGTYTLWNFYEWTLYKILAQTAIGGKNAQALIGSGNSSGSGSTTTGLSNAGGPYAAGGSGNSAYAKVFIENAWGSVLEFVDNTYLKNRALYAGSALSNSLSADNPVVSGAEYVPTTTRLSVPASMSQHDIYRQSLDSATWDMPIPLSSGTYPKNTTNPTGASGDSIWTNNSQNSSLIVGGAWSFGASDGLSAWASSNDLSRSDPAFGARLAYMMTADAAGTGSDYTVSFEETQSSRTTSTKVSPGDSVLLPTVKPVTGYDFAGWYSDSQCTQEYIGPAGSYFKPVGSTTLYSKFVESDDYYTIHVSKGEAGSTADYDMYVKKGESMALPAAADIPGYTFSGWYTGVSAGTLTDPVGIPGQYYTPSADIYLSPKYTQLTSATITFSANSSTVQTISSYNGKTITLPDAPGVADKLFVGWYSNSGLTTFAGYAGAPYTITATATLYAKYIDSAEYWVVTVYTGVSGTTQGYTVAVEKGMSMILPQAAEVSGKVFDGWSTASARSSADAGLAGQYYKPTADCGIYPKYSDAPSTYAVTVNKGSAGNETDYTLNVTVGDSIVLPKAAAIDGYTFNGWYLTSTSGTYLGQPGGYYKPTAACTLAPKYTQLDAWTITLMQWDGDGSATTDYTSAGTVKVVKGQSTQLPYAKYFENYTLKYWATYSSGFTQAAAPGQLYTPGSDVTLYPIYGPIATTSTYSVTVMDTTNGTDYSEGDVVKVQQGSSIRLPSAPVISGKVFDHWSTYVSAVQENNLGIVGQFYQPSADVKIAPVYVAAYTVAVQKVTSEMTVATLTYATDYTLTIASGDSILLPTAAVKDGYSLVGWSLSGNSTVSIGAPGAYYFPTGASISLYPIYSESSASGYWSVKLHQKNETDYQTVIVSKGYPLMLPEGKTESGFTFSDWATKSGSTYTSVGTAGQYWTPTANTDLYSRYDAVTTQSVSLAYLKDGQSSTASDLASYITASLSSSTIVDGGYVYLVINKVGVCDYTVSADHAYVVPLVDGLYRLYSKDSTACTVIISVTTQFTPGYGWFNVAGIANQGRAVQVSMIASNEMGLSAGTMDIGGVYCRYDNASGQWVYGSIENMTGVDAQTITGGSQTFSGTFTLPEGYSVYYVYGIYTATDEEPQYSGGQIGPAMPTLEG